jgi:hypothetical protein
MYSRSVGHTIVMAAAAKLRVHMLLVWVHCTILARARIFLVGEGNE